MCIGEDTSRDTNPLEKSLHPLDTILQAHNIAGEMVRWGAVVGGTERVTHAFGGPLGLEPSLGIAGNA